MRQIIVALCVLALPVGVRAQSEPFRKAREMKIAGIVLMSAGAGAFGGGAVLVGVGVSQNSDATCVDMPGVIGCGSRSINGEMIAGWTAMAVGLVAVGIGVPLFIVGRERLRRGTTRVSIAGPGSAALAFGAW